ncbi:LPD29 domain-containing protein [Promicromonospora sp. NPDC057138]|uniref:LPD29 domain-containing protein n=1 Tax=Promicromonospora sp. NPDC057138 TaxID=3346031 RepID=UPI0036399DAA
MSDPARRPRGAPDSAGGQFAPNARDEQSIELPRPVERIDAKRSAAALRSDLRRRFPGTQVSVRMATGTAYGWVDVSWTDGPRELTVGRIGFEYQSEQFDGSDDAYRQVNTHQSTRYGLSGVLTRREIGTAGQLAIDAWFQAARITSYERFDPVSGERATGERGYDSERPLTEAECARLRLPQKVIDYYPTIGLAVSWYHRHLDFTGDQPVFEDSL